MPTLMLVNPRKRRKARASGAAKRRSPARRRARRSVSAAPFAAIKRRTYRRARRANPIMSGRRGRIRRRRNPISKRSLSGGSIMRMLKDAAIGGSGAVAVDLIMAKLNGMLPPSLQPTANVGANDAVRVALTVVLGKVLSRSTRGMSEKMAAGALIVQASRILAPLVARVVPGAAAVNGLAYATPYATIPGQSRISPSPRGVSAFTPAGTRTPLLAGAQVGMFTRGPSPMLSASRGGRGSMRAR